MFDIDTFNELYVFGETQAIDYLYNNCNLDLSNLYNTIISLHKYIIECEITALISDNLYEIYSELEDIFFKKVGIVFDFNVDKYVLRG